MDIDVATYSAIAVQSALGAFDRDSLQSKKLQRIRYLKH
jgi:hypothetical protein